MGGLTLSDTVLYGTTTSGGTLGNGMVFKLSTDGTGFTVLRNFADSDGRCPNTRLIMSSNVLYGTTYSGGSWDNGTVFKVNTDGTGFTVLKDFAGGSDGAYPQAALALSGNVLYGTTHWGGNDSNYGTVFQLYTDGTGFTVLHNFTGKDGANPYAGLTLAGNVLYGATVEGGDLGEGTVFKLDLSVPPLLTIQSLADAVVLRWSSPAFALQAAPGATGIYTDIPGATSPYTNAVTDDQKFFRLAR
jgi:uncharacterized repeat protein (TIGR03803 family)